VLSGETTPLSNPRSPNFFGIGIGIGIGIGYGPGIDPDSDTDPDTDRIWQGKG
jgi:hypothetical protein